MGLETMNVTGLLNPPDGAIVRVELPVFAARMATGLTADADMLKSGPGTVTSIVTFRDRTDGAVPVVPVTVMLKLVLGT